MIPHPSEKRTVTMLHILPADGIGGAEIAAHSSIITDRDDISLLFLSNPTHIQPKKNVCYAPGSSALTPRSALSAMRLADEIQPDILLFSLWRTILAFLVLRVAVRKPKFILFLHSDRSVHLIDRFATWLMCLLSDEVWADSNSSAHRRIGLGKSTGNRRVISFLLERNYEDAHNTPQPRFIFWGRIANEKRIDRAISFFSAVEARFKDAHFVVIGPDRGRRTELEERTRELGISEKVHFTGPMPLQEICQRARDASFYLQLSDFEGMAISVVEAMQLGLVPIVTPVGEIGNYCRDLENAIIFSTMDDTVRKFTMILSDPVAFARMSASAREQWSSVPLYREDIRAAMQCVVGTVSKSK